MVQDQDRSMTGLSAIIYLFHLDTEHFMRHVRLDELQVEIKIDERSINNLRCVDDATLMAESEEELKRPLDGSERGE